MVAMFVIVDLQIMFHIKTQVFHDSNRMSINKCLQDASKVKEDTSEVLHLVYGLAWCWNLDILEIGSEVPGNVWNALVEKDGKDQFGWSFNKWSVTKSKDGQEYPTKKQNKNK